MMVALRGRLKNTKHMVRKPESWWICSGTLLKDMKIVLGDIFLLW